MSSLNNIPLFAIPTGNFSLKVDRSKESKFDTLLRKKWRDAETNGVFRYVLNIKDSKVLNGKYRFLVQLNTDRGENRRQPEDIYSMDQPFSTQRFNFTKLAMNEIIMDLGDGSGEDIIAVNVSPLESYHSLLLTQRFQQLPQIMTEHSLRTAITLFSLSCSPYLRLAFNSLCAHASVNHLHWHLYYLKERMLLEDIDLEDYIGPVKLLKNYPGKGFCIKYSSAGTIDNLITCTVLIVNYLQKKQIAHNVYITRAMNDKVTEEYKDLRVYIWGRKSHKGVKDTCAFIPAVCELFGHLSIRSEEAYAKLTEDYVVDVLKDITEDIFSSAVEEVQELLKGQINDVSTGENINK